MVGYRPVDRLGLEGGLELGYLLNDGAYNSALDLSLDLGAVFSITKELKAGVRYVLGINSVYKQDFEFKDEMGNLSNAVVIFPNRVLQLSLYYRLAKL